MNAKDIAIKDIKLNVLIYGKSGTGKTTFACTFPRCFVFDFDKGMLSQRGKDVEYETYDNYQLFETKLASLERSCPYDTLVLDSVTTLQEYMMDKILAANRKAIPTLHEWNVLISTLKDLFMRLTKMTNHLVVTAHEQVLQDEITSEIMIRPLIVGKKLPAQLPLWFDETYRSQVGRDKEGNPVYSLLTRSDIKYMAKSRLDCLETVENWTKADGYSLIVNKMKGVDK